jgi:hypothetical protein
LIVDYRDPPEEAAFRDRLRGWLAERAGDFLERAVLATLDFATTAEEQSFQTDDFRSSIAKLTTGRAS